MKKFKVVLSVVGIIGIIVLLNTQIVKEKPIVVPDKIVDKEVTLYSIDAIKFDVIITDSSKTINHQISELKKEFELHSGIWLYYFFKDSLNNSCYITQFTPDIALQAHVREQQRVNIEYAKAKQELEYAKIVSNIERGMLETIKK